ncbi:hypothetical protein CWT12_06440 [Actinomyces sp. 432]|uniref:hypothetical protein n=1 Tax=Actinomyces sp. 432 TaxID=2057798 RepID=UPI0013742F12|nr:hypothetical protein [Actinomyces sp. 432]QHO91026.1 hypothetical protein CWT12_06440 [Actinomyces sp. 432]
MANNRIDAANAHIFGSDDDSLYLGAYDPDLAGKVTGLYAAVPSGFVDCGWISEDGVGLTFDDSVTKIKGHQGHAVVKTFMDSSESALSATLLESKLDSLRRYLDVRSASRESEKVGSETKAVAKLVVPSSRKVITLSGILDLFDVSGQGVKYRMVFPHLELGERGELAFRAGEITAYEHTLSVLDDWLILTDAPALVPSA